MEKVELKAMARLDISGAMVWQGRRGAEGHRTQRGRGGKGVGKITKIENMGLDSETVKLV